MIVDMAAPSINAGMVFGVNVVELVIEGWSQWATVKLCKFCIGSGSISSLVKKMEDALDYINGRRSRCAQSRVEWSFLACD